MVGAWARARAGAGRRPEVVTEAGAWVGAKAAVNAGAGARGCSRGKSRARAWGSGSSRACC